MRRCARCSPSRWPTASRAARRCASARCCTTRPSPRPGPSPPTADVLGFPRQRRRGRALARRATRLRTSENLRAHVSLLARHHLGLGYLVHKAPLDRRTVHRYLVKTAPVEVDVTLLSIADRLATRGRKAHEAIAKHSSSRGRAARALACGRGRRSRRWCAATCSRMSWTSQPGPDVGALLALLAEARFAGEIDSGDGALALARTLVVAGVCAAAQARAIVPMTTRTASATVS